MPVIKSKKAITVFAVIFLLNLLLFAVKLYVGLSSNSISIYSDGINNFFDSLSSLASIICFYVIAKSADSSVNSRSEKAEQLLTFILSAVIVIVGFVFLYNSAERLMYPTPVWFTASYFITLSLTAVVKLLMFALLKKQSKKQHSDVMKVMSVDSLTDFFITSVTVATLHLSQKGSFSLDAYVGIAISLLIMISGIKSLKNSTAELLNYPDKKTRIKAEEIILSKLNCEEFELEFSFIKEKSIYLHFEKTIEKETLEQLKEKVYNETGMNFYVLN